MKQIFSNATIGLSIFLNASTVNINSDKFKVNASYDTNIDLKLQTQVFREVELNYSGPAIAASLLNFYYDFDANQHHIAHYMRTNIGHYGTYTHDFFYFLHYQINYKYELMTVIQHFGSNLPAIKFLIMQVYQDLQAKILPIILLNGTLPGQEPTINQYIIINGIYGTLEQPSNVNFEFLNTSPGLPKHGIVKGRQMNLLWNNAPGCYFGLSQHNKLNF